MDPDLIPQLRPCMAEAYQAWWHEWKGQGVRSGRFFAKGVLPLMCLFSKLSCGVLFSARALQCTCKVTKSLGLRLA